FRSCPVGRGGPDVPRADDGDLLSGHALSSTPCTCAISAWTSRPRRILPRSFHCDKETVSHRRGRPRIGWGADRNGGLRMPMFRSPFAGVVASPEKRRTKKPRREGVTMVIDKGMGVEATRDLF